MKTKRQPRCTDLLAPVVKCCVCGADVHTCENKNSLVDQRCPAHPDGCELRNGDWVCSDGCWSRATMGGERKQ